MKAARILLSVVLLLNLAGLVDAERPNSEPGDFPRSIWQRETLTNGFWGLNDELAHKGIELGLSATQIYQQNVRGGISRHRRAGRFAGSYDLELSADLGKLLGLEGAAFYMLTEGSYSNGIDKSSVGSFFGVNDDAAGDRSMDITELWYEHAFLDDSLRIRVGKLDLTGGFEHHGCPVGHTKDLPDMLPVKDP
jgi:carbohydrate-selective porin OprB